MKDFFDKYRQAIIGVLIGFMVTGTTAIGSGFFNYIMLPSENKKEIVESKKRLTVLEDNSSKFCLRAEVYHMDSILKNDGDKKHNEIIIIVDENTKAIRSITGELGAIKMNTSKIAGALEAKGLRIQYEPMTFSIDTNYTATIE